MEDEKIKNMKALRKSRSLSEAMQMRIKEKMNDKDEVVKEVFAEEGTN